MLGALAGTADAAGRLRTAAFDPERLASATGERAMNRVDRTGSTAVRLVLPWLLIAPKGAPPAGFDPRDPDDPAYRWENVNIDAQVIAARANGLEPILVLLGTPSWAKGAGDGPGPLGTERPNPVAYGHFAAAAAKRFSGGHRDSEGGLLPRVRWWQAWNEPNNGHSLYPALPDGPAHYRRMLNSFAAAVHGVDPTNVVLTGGTSPFGKPGITMAPMRFMRELLCMSRTRPYRPVCAHRTEFDVWSHHPYSLGGPTAQAFAQDDVSVADLREMRTLLVAARKAGRIVSAAGTPRRTVAFWVTEFGWDSNPPDPHGVPAARHARWTSEALFRMWQAGVTLVTWFLLYDRPIATSLYQTGLHYYAANPEDARPKPSLRAFRFPFVAFRRSTGVFVWGRTPAEAQRTVAIERRTASGWRRVGFLTTNRYGIFSKTYSAVIGTSMRARMGTEISFPFSLKQPPPYRIDEGYGPFGCGKGIRC